MLKTLEWFDFISFAKIKGYEYKLYFKQSFISDLDRSQTPESGFITGV